MGGLILAPWGPSGVTPSVSVILSPNLPSRPSGRESPHPQHRARPRGARPVLFPLLGPKAGPRTEELVSQESRRSREKQWAVPGIPSPRRCKGNAGLNSQVGKDVCFRQSLIQQLRELHQEQVYWALVVTQRGLPFRGRPGLSAAQLTPCRQALQAGRGVGRGEASLGHMGSLEPRVVERDTAPPKDVREGAEEPHGRQALPEAPG